MTGKPVRPRQQARQDIRSAAAYYRREAGEVVALGFLDAVRAAIRDLSDQPRAGSLRYAGLLDMAGLRMWPVARYPYLLFYVEREDHVDLRRILRGRRDVGALLEDRG